MDGFRRPYSSNFRDFYMLFMFFFSLASVAVLGVAGYMTTQLSNLSPFYGIGIGVSAFVSLVFVVASLGCCAACSRSNSIMKFVSGVTLLLLSAQVAFGVYLYSRDSVSESSTRSWYNAPVSVRQAIQDDFQCCGWEFYIPSPHCPWQTFRACQALVVDRIQNYERILTGVAAGFAIFETIASVGGCFLASKLRSDSSPKYIYG